MSPPAQLEPSGTRKRRIAFRAWPLLLAAGRVLIVLLAIQASGLHRLLYPDVVFGAGKIVMQTLRLPVQQLVDLGVEPRDLRSIALLFNGPATGVVYVGDVQLSN